MGASIEHRKLHASFTIASHRQKIPNERERMILASFIADRMMM
jgi:hypothetical protein